MIKIGKENAYLRQKTREAHRVVEHLERSANRSNGGIRMFCVFCIAGQLITTLWQEIAGRPITVNIPGLGLATTSDLLYSLLAVGAFVPNRSAARKWHLQLNLIIVCGFLLYFFLVIIGIANENAVGVAVADARILIGMLAAVCFVKHVGISVKYIHKTLLYLCVLANCIALFVVLKGTAQSQVGIDRVGVTNAFYTSLTLNFTCIGWLLFSKVDRKQQILSIAIFVVTGIEVLISQTRSYLLCIGALSLLWVIYFFVSVILPGKMFRFSLQTAFQVVFASLTTLLLLVIALGSEVTNFVKILSDSVITRFSVFGSDVNVMSRQQEVEAMFANMEGVDWLIGKGAGATFTIVSWDQVLVLQSAHVVAFTFLFKAGVIVFLAVCVVPPTMAIIRVFRFVARGGKSLSDFPNFAADASLITLTCLLFTSFGWGSSLGFAFVLIFGLRKIGLHEEEVKKRYSRVSYIN